MECLDEKGGGGGGSHGVSLGLWDQGLELGMIE